VNTSTSVAPTIVLAFLAVSSAACLDKYAHDPAEVEPQTPAALCRGAEPEEGEFCLPGEAVLEILHGNRFEVIGVEAAKSGVSRPAMLTLASEYRGRPFVFRVKWKPAPESGDALNNSPRREIAAYEIQKFFLEPHEYVVPPTVGHCFPAKTYREQIGAGTPQFAGTDCVFGVLSYWLENVTDEAIWDAERYESDARYRDVITDLNVFTYLVDHGDSREGNLLLSTDETRVRAFAVDNGLTFGTVLENFIHNDWKKILVPELSSTIVDRLRRVEPADLVALGNAAQFRKDANGVLVSEAAELPDAPPSEGVRWKDPMLRMGLDGTEIDAVKNRLNALLERVEKRELAVRR
jgi:hypothetical protein